MGCDGWVNGRCAFDENVAFGLLLAGWPLVGLWLESVRCVYVGSHDDQRMTGWLMVEQGAIVRQYLVMNSNKSTDCYS